MTSIAAACADIDNLHKQLTVMREQRDAARKLAADMTVSRDEARRVHAATSRQHAAEIGYLHILCEELREENDGLRCRIDELEP